MVTPLELIDLTCHVVVADDSIQAPLVHFSVIESKCHSVCAEPSGTANSVQVCVWLWLTASAWHIEVDDQLSLGHVDTSSDQVSSDEHVDLLLSETLHGAVSLVFRHLGEHNIRLQICFSEHSVNNFSKILRVHENESLGELANIENLFNKINFLSLLTFHDVLLDGLELVHRGLWGEFDLVSLSDDL